MKKFNLFAVAFVAVFTQSVIANAAKTNRGYFYFDAKKSEAKSVFAMGTDVAAMGIAKEAYPPMQRGAMRGVEYPQTERGKC